MSPEPEQNAPKAAGEAGLDTAGSNTAGTNTAGSKAAGSKAARSNTAGSKAAGSKAAGSKPRAGVPVWRTGKPDAVLADAVDAARAAVESIAPAEQIGRHLSARSEGDRLVTHLFESKLAGYGGWQWYAVLTRNSRSRVVTVDELGLLPSEDSILAPEWVPWAERVRPEDAQDEEAAEQAPGSPAAEQAADAPEGDSDDADGDGADEEYDEDDADEADGDADGDAGGQPAGEAD
ncbi:DUF3027 domain-containing protein [Pseudarthrobacter sp. O4]|uniref:DUF3027 domain-containing protein n=1 Tax=Pseudarthrobacter sp. O4 TaxID=3418417 RepID=UPI003CE778BA